MHIRPSINKALYHLRNKLLGILWWRTQFYMTWLTKLLRIHFWNCPWDAVRIFGRNMQIISSLFNEIERSWAEAFERSKKRTFLLQILFLWKELTPTWNTIQNPWIIFAKNTDKGKKGIYTHSIPEIILVAHHSIADHSWDQTWFVLVFWLWLYWTLC